MTPKITAAIAGLSLVLGISIGMAAKQTGAGVAIIQGLGVHDAGLAALAEAERLAGSGSWELIAVGRVYYLSGDKDHGQSLFERATSGKQESADYARLGRVYAEAGERAKATDSFQKMLDLEPKDSTVLAEAGAWYLRIGNRAKGEELLAQVLKKHPNDMDSFLRASEALLQVSEGT